MDAAPGSSKRWLYEASKWDASDSKEASESRPVSSSSFLLEFSLSDWGSALAFPFFLRCSCVEVVTSL